MKHLLTAPNVDDPYLFPFRPIYDPKRGMDQFSQECLPELQDDPAYARVIVGHFYSLEDLSKENKLHRTSGGGDEHPLSHP